MQFKLHYLHDHILILSHQGNPFKSESGIPYPDKVGKSGTSQEDNLQRDPRPALQ